MQGLKETFLCSSYVVICPVRWSVMVRPGTFLLRNVPKWMILTLSPLLTVSVIILNMAFTVRSVSALSTPVSSAIFVMSSDLVMNRGGVL